MYTWKGDGPTPDFDQDTADILVGKRVLIGITYTTREDTVLRQEQIHGIVKAATRESVMVALQGSHEGEIREMPPNFESLEPARPGDYRLRSTGEVVANPDYLWTWTMRGDAEN